MWLVQWVESVRQLTSHISTRSNTKLESLGLRFEGNMLLQLHGIQYLWW